MMAWRERLLYPSHPAQSPNAPWPLEGRCVSSVRVLPTQRLLWKFLCRSDRMYSEETYSQAFRDDLSTSQHRSLRQSLVDAKSIGILIIDDHVVIRTALRMFLECQPGLTVVGEVSHPKDALAIALHEHPDIILLDLDLGDANGLDLLPQLQTAAPA